MSLINEIFGKQIDKLELNDFKSYFNSEREESAKIEFKSGGVDISDLYKEICAFLNTDGGVIFIGSPRETKKDIGKKRQKRVCIGSITPSSFRGKGWIMEKIASNISPFPNGIDIKEFNDENGSFFLIEVPQSQAPPHQCVSEGKYYIRIDESAKPAPHGIVESLFQKRKRPLIKIEIDINAYQDKPFNELELSFKIINESENPTENLSYSINLINIKSVYSSKYQQNAENPIEKGKNHYDIQGNSKRVLLKGLVLPISFNVIHLSEPFLVLTNVWGKDFGMVEKHFIWDQKNGSVLDESRNKDGTEKEIVDLKKILDKAITDE